MPIDQAHAAADMAVTLAHKLHAMSKEERRRFSGLCFDFCRGMAADSYIRTTLNEISVLLHELTNGSLK